ncbi:hypothetical protein [Streptomyces sp. NBC_01235]|uniref:hypothetical protein n=1 Tax=Streptomyces sp. NBC_01235 TaxID=2903788 RepID=UPI002E0F434F
MPKRRVVDVFVHGTADPEPTVAGFGSRAIHESGRSLKGTLAEGRTVRLTGFVTHGDDGAWDVTRLLVTCCAADATTSKADTGVTVTGTWRPKGRPGSDGARPPALDAGTVARVEQPADPDEKPWRIPVSPVGGGYPAATGGENARGRRR